MDIIDVANMGAYTIAESVVTMIDSGDSLEKIRKAMVEVIDDTISSVPHAVKSMLTDLNNEYKGEK